LNKAGLSQKPKHVASNKTDRNLASIDLVYFTFALRVSKQDVTGKDNKINREGKKPLALQTEPQWQTRRSLRFKLSSYKNIDFTEIPSNFKTSSYWRYIIRLPAAKGQFFSHL